MGAGCSKRNQISETNNTIVIQNKQQNLLLTDGSRKNSIRKLSMVSTRSIRSAIVEAQQDLGKNGPNNREIHETIVKQANAKNNIKNVGFQNQMSVNRGPNNPGGRKMSVFDRGYNSVKEALLETQMANDLLYKMMPKSIATQLKNKQPVEPQEFETVTVFFSDIVSFTSLALESKPQQILTMLDDLYTIRRRFRQLRRLQG